MVTGQLLETRQFKTIQSGGIAFVTGIYTTAIIVDFTYPGWTATLQWSQAKQSFVVTELQNMVATEVAYSICHLCKGVTIKSRVPLFLEVVAQVQDDWWNLCF